MRLSVYKLGLAVALTVAWTFLGASYTSAQRLSRTEQAELNAATKNPDVAARAAALKKFLADHPKSPAAGLVRQMLLMSLVEAKAPAAEITAVADAAVADLPNGPGRIRVYRALAEMFAAGGEQLDKALAYAERAVCSVPAGEELDEMRASARGTLGFVRLKRGETDKAIATLSEAAADASDDQEILLYLGMAYEKSGRADEAIDAYSRSVAVFLGEDQRASEPLRALYQKRHGSLEGLDERIAAAREKSLRRIALDSRREDRPAPAWELRDLSGKTVKMSDFKGKLIVMDFWGSWCPPCREELPSFQAMYDKYKDRGVVFLGMNWERAAEPGARMKAVTDFMARNKYTFPVIIDHDRVAVEAYEIEGFPTVFVIDKTGTIRYRNVGYDEGVEQIIEAQLNSLMK